MPKVGDINYNKAPNVQIYGEDDQFHRAQLVAIAAGEIKYSDPDVSPNVQVSDENGVFHRATLVAIPGGGGGAIDDRIIIKSATIPQASEDEFGKIYCYSGATNATYTHGYIYECVAGNINYEGVIGIYPTMIAFDYTKGTLVDFFEEFGFPNYTKVVNGTMTYLADGDLWNFVGKDSNDNIIFEDFKLYSQDLKDYGFVFINPQEEYTDGLVLEYDIVWTETKSDYSWQRIDVQPSFQLETMPSANYEYVGGIYQYVGQTDANYTMGYFYKCDMVQTPEDFTPTVVSCSASIDLDIMKESFGSASNWTHVFAYDADGEVWHLDGGSEDIASLEGYGIEVESLSAGATITCVYVAATTTFNWEQVNVQPDLTAIEDYDPSANQVLENVYGTLKWIYK